MVVITQASGIKTMRAAKRAAGFTLLEAMISVVILGVLAAMAGPSFSTMVANQRMKGASSDLFGSLTMARSEALKRNQSVTVTPATTLQWESGWSTANPTSAGLFLEKHDAIAKISIGGPESITFTPNGRVSGGTAASFSFSATGTSAQRCLKTDLSGRPYILQSACTP
jgi:type IV fimbrial biogenesis protein FimT